MIGAIGFAVEAITLTFLTGVVGWAAWHSRMISFPLALAITWTLNRKYTFRGQSAYGRVRDALGYTVIQSMGSLINLVVFRTALELAPVMHTLPVIALAIGAVAGLSFNFIVSRTILYKPALADGDKP